VTNASDHHRARRLALQGLCALDVQGGKALDLVLSFLQESRETVSTLEEAQEMLRGAFLDREVNDALLAGQSQHWNVSRMALVDRNILRLAVWELQSQHLSRKIIITEAIHLAKEFASAESPRFVNGVLDAVAKKLAAPGEVIAPGEIVSPDEVVGPEEHEATQERDGRSDDDE
jgi:transcription antitermination protein NusB